MQPLYRKTQTRHLDQLATQVLGISDFELMQKAGHAAASVLQDLVGSYDLPASNRILVIAGSGNNAGDGYVLALACHLAGLPVAVWPQIAPDKLSPSALKARQHFEQAEGRMLPVAEAGRETAESWQADWLVDALLGTGITRPVSGHYAQIINWMNGQALPVFSLDVPSGLDADTGCPQGVAVRASHTITFIALKPGLFSADGPDYCGELFYCDLDMPEATMRQEPPTAWLLETEDVQHPGLQRRFNCHKGQFGHVLVIGGNSGMAGAAMLCASAALRSGAGKVTAMCLAPHAHLIPLRQPEIMSATVSNLPRLLNAADVIALGPGLGQNATAQSIFRQCLETGNKTKQRMVLDADALNLLARQTHPPRLPDTCVLTPHPGEAARLLGCDTADIQADRLQAATRLADQYQCAVVLKGNGSIIATPGDTPQICPFGTPGMASAGMGDGLTGVIAALLGQGLTSQSAASTGVLAHALAAEAASKGNGLLASDVIEQLPNIFP